MSQLDSMKIDILNVAQETGPITLLANFKNLDLTGLGKAKVYLISGFDKDSDAIEIRFKTPLATCAAPYKISGTILYVPLAGEGNSKLNFG